MSQIDIKNSIVMNMIKQYVHGFQFCYGGDNSVGRAKGLEIESC